MSTTPSAGVHYLYRCYDADGALLYVGLTSEPNRRIATHEGGRGKQEASAILRLHMFRSVVEDIAHLTKALASAAETRAIYTEQPLLNYQDRCVPRWFVKGQIADYLSGRPVREWPMPINPSVRVTEALAAYGEAVIA